MSDSSNKSAYFLRDEDLGMDLKDDEQALTVWGARSSTSSSSLVVAGNRPNPKMQPDFETRFKTTIQEVENKLLNEEISTFMKLRARIRKLPDREFECPFVLSMCWAISECGPGRVISAFKNDFAQFFKSGWLPVLALFPSHFSFKKERNANTIITGMTDLLFCDNFMTIVTKTAWSLGSVHNDWTRGIDTTLSLIKAANETKIDNISDSEQYFGTAFGKTMNEFFGQLPAQTRQALTQICRNHKIEIQSKDPEQLSIKD